MVPDAKGMKPVAIIPARGGSRRIPRKNIAPVGGRPMIVHVIEAARKSNIFSDVMVSTEDKEIAGISAAAGASVIDRPPELATDEAFEVDVYAQVLSALDTVPEYFCAVYPTAIFLQAEDFEKSFALISGKDGPDVIMGVSRYPIHPFKALATDGNGFLQMIHPDKCLQRSQTYPEYVASNGTFYWFRTDNYLRYKTYYPARLKGYELPPSRAPDIDEPDDLKIAEALMSLQKKI